MADVGKGGATVLRWTVEVNREDLERNDITKPSKEWEPSDLAHADSLGLIYAWAVEVISMPDPSRRGDANDGRDGAMDDAEGSCRDCAALTAFLLDLLAAHRNRRPLTFTDIAETERILDLHWREGFTPREEQPVPEPERTTGEQGSSGRRVQTGRMVLCDEDVE